MNDRPDERPIALLRLVVVLAALVPIVMFAGAAFYLYHQAVADARLRVDRAARTAEEHALKVVETNIALLNRVLDILGDDDAETLLAREASLHDVLTRMTANLPQLQGIFIMDETGHLVATNRAYPAPHAIDFTDRAFFQHHRDSGAQPYITDVLTSRTTGELFFDVSLRRNREGGRFGGAVSSSLTPLYFGDFYREVTSGDEAFGIALVRADGAVLASWPRQPVASDSGKSSIGIGLRNAQAVAENGLPDVGNGLVATRALEGYPIKVVAWTLQSAVRASWLEDLALLAAVMLPLTLSLMYVAWIALRTTRRSLASLQALQEETAQRQHAEVALLQAQKLEALGRLTGGVAHDFNNLLMVITNNLYLHKRLGGVAESRELGAIDRAVTAGAKLTHQLLSFSRRQTSHPEPIRLQDKLPATADLLMPALGSAIELTVDVDPKTSTVEVDQAELELALLNLAINARDAMPSGGKLEIRARDAPPGDPVDGDRAFVVIALRDTGTGIDADILSRVFEPFFTTKPVGQGTGLGLSQVYGFCVRSGGTAIARSEAGQGSEMRMYFPALHRGAAAGTQQHPAHEANLRGSRVLLVEDMAEVAAATEAVLAEMGCAVTRVVNADEAKSHLLVAADQIDLVLSDIVMPGVLNGIELAAWMREALPHLPVVLMSGYSESVAASEAQGLRILEKPVTPARLAQALAAVLATHRQA